MDQQQWIIARGGEVVWGPGAWEPAVLSAQLGALGHSVSFGALAAAWSAANGTVKVLPCPVTVPGYDPQTQRLAAAVVTLGAGGTTATAAHAVVNRPLDELRAERKAAARARRWLAEVGGVAVGDVRIATDDRAKGLLNGKYRTAEKNPDMLHRWDGEAGEMALTSAQVIAIGDAVADHVQACFDHSLDLIAALDAATTTAQLMAVDLEAGWPGVSRDV